MPRAALAFAAGTLTLCGCEREQAVGTAAPPTSVSVIELRSGTPRDETVVAGVVEPYRQSDTSFDVAGLLTEVIDLGDTVRGPQLDGRRELLTDGEGLPVQMGAVLARLDQTRFEQAVTAAELSLASTERQIEALNIELADVYPARVANARASAAASSAEVQSARESVSAAEAELELARVTVERDRALIESGAIAQTVLDQSESSFRTATANAAQARAALDAALQSEQSALASQAEVEGEFRVREADRESLFASRAELQNEVDRARTDLDSSVLRAPFHGRVTGRFVERGSYITAGARVVELTMEEAIKVVITVSAEQERQLEVGARLPIYVDLPSGSPTRPLMGTVYEKTSQADSGTRTFRVGIILPNLLLGDGGPYANGPGASRADLFPVLNLPGFSPDAQFVNVACAFDRDGTTQVLAIPGSAGGGSLAGTVLVPTSVRVTFADDWQQLDTSTLRRIEPNDQLQIGDALVLDPRSEHESGFRVGNARFALRPGDVVRVGVDADLPGEGYWVPASAILPRSGDTLVFSVAQGQAREVVVDIIETSGAFRRIDAAQLREGMPIVVRGMQYLTEGDAVSVRQAAGEAE